MAPPSRPRRFARAVGRALAVALVTVLLLEAALWLFFPAPTRETVERYTQDIPGLAREVTYERNSFGVRSQRMRTRARPPSTVRLLAIGASTTDQSTQNGPDTWSGILERRLDDEFAPRGVRVEIGAYGRGGESVYDTFAWARENVVDLEADGVVTLLGINDLAWHGRADYHYDRATRDRRLYEGVTHFCRRWSQACRWAIRIEEQIRVRRALARGDAVEWHTRHLPDFRRGLQSLPERATLARDPDPFVEFSDGVDLLFGWLEAHRVPTVVMAQPVLWRPAMGDAERALLWFTVATPAGPAHLSTAWLYAEMERYNAAQRDAAARHGARFFAPAIPPTVENFFDDCHYTDAGSRLLADQLYPHARALVLEAATRRGLLH